MAVDVVSARFPAQECRPLKRRRLGWDADAPAPALCSSDGLLFSSPPFTVTPPPINAQDSQKKSLDGIHPARPVCNALPPQLKDDIKGHLNFNLGGSLTQRYKIIRKMGEGTFGRVLECWDRDAHEVVAIKVIRSAEKYREAAMVEIDVLFNIGKERIGARGCVQIKRWFEYENHICIVFEKLGPSLFDFLRANSYIPFSVDLVREFGRQILESVAYMHSLNLIHTDLKPENILLFSPEFTTVVDSKNASKKSVQLKRVPKSSRIKLIDFGSTTSYKKRSLSIISTRHYRAPEVILGLGWGYPCDIWSVGCILVELCSGELLFQTHENLEHLAMMEQVLGPIPSYLIRNIRGGADGHFRHKRKLNWPEGATSKESVRAVRRLPPLQDLIMEHADHSASSLIDLLQQLLNYDPAERPTAKEALRHPFFQVSRR